jgi:hypothetical protein
LSNYRKWKADVENRNFARDEKKETCTTCANVNERLKVNHMKNVKGMSHEQGDHGPSCPWAKI